GNAGHRPPLSREKLHPLADQKELGRNDLEVPGGVKRSNSRSTDLGSRVRRDDLERSSVLENVECVRVHTEPSALATDLHTPWRETSHQRGIDEDTTMAVGRGGCGRDPRRVPRHGK